MKRKANSCPIPLETVLNVRDENRLWFYIPGFNGYEVSNDGYLRSMKHYKKYPFGMLIRPINKDGNMYELSNDYNKRVQMSISQIMKLARENPYAVSSYPRKTYTIDTKSRNKKMFIPRETINKKQVHNTHFSIIGEDRDNIIKPIYFIY